MTGNAISLIPASPSAGSNVASERRSTGGAGFRPPARAANPLCREAVVATNDGITQLYFEGELRNRTDRIFDPALVLSPTPIEDGQVATFNFVVATA